MRTNPQTAVSGLEVWQGEPKEYLPLKFPEVGRSSDDRSAACILWG